MKFSDILKSANTNLWHNKGRTILTVIAVMIGALTIAITVGINNGVNNYVSKQVANVGSKGLMEIVPADATGQQADGPQKYEANRGSATDQQNITPSKLKKLKAMKSLKDMQPVQDMSIDYVQGPNHSKYTIQAQPPVGINVDLKRGRQAAKNGHSQEIVLANEYIKALGFKSAQQALGKTIKVAASSQATNQRSIVTAKIVGIRNQSIIQGSQSIISQALADRVSNINQAGLPAKMKQNYYGVTATVKNPTDANIAKVKKQLAKQGYDAQTFQDQVGQLRQVVNAITGVLIVFGAIALLAASFGVINTLYMSVRDRTREIGLMKALGLSRGKVFLIFSCESLLIGLIGSVLGILLAAGIGQILNQLAVTSFLKGLAGFTLVQFTLPSVVAIIVIIMLIAFLAGTLPARRAAKLDPMTALRYE
ncbi:ABC transporter permease [Bombilactobacillus bombi]|uniref:ABC transporter permease n=1 Tax=Bombilactobacillus bombi TaxID=1303590 RepID=A0A417ZJM5_9LACO|nr:ABC transporter permease [Bombilactobacillus bombi]RHW52041.1 ABC transporter permease [Bombilactobacillus bombi]